MNAFPDAAAKIYDDNIVRLVPGYALALELMAAILAVQLSGPCRILVPGCGTGAEILAIANSLPEASFVAVEPSAGMLDLARQRIAAAGLSERVEFVSGYLDDVGERGRFDAATVSLVLHFLPDDGAKQAFLSGVAQRLAANAPLLLLDAPSVAFDESALRQWLLTQHGPGVPPPDAVIKRMQTLWHRATPERIAELLARTGFAEQATFFQTLGYVGTSARMRLRSVD
ncbi:class I SAM-dependent methyltransferase [Hyphomicrobium sp. D-2]|uniref:class I SAM-dependent methyltransferase n=1 Tax=Hyphomicrobium sp. D-2 TaxID=3041621 RepID=UPI002453F110|nr:class I SAM-dependent methyltransferase [Hyphomicrobium sp. D-2]MDH4982139.1 class I SAM-dependent methyltransferase [Hyphomicrobium sp. D-2]